MRVISDEQISSLLTSLSKEGVLKFQDVLKKALEKYHKDPTLIPERIVINREDNDAVHIFMPSFAERVGIKTLGGSKEGFKGAVSILDETNGDLLGVLNATTLTAFRTALASTIPLVKFFDGNLRDQTITVYGNGPQAYWHVRLTLILFPESFKKVQIAVRSINEKSNSLKESLSNEFNSIEFEILGQGFADVSKSSVIFGCVPSTEPAIKFDNLSKDSKTFISLIGSYKPHMAEVDNETVLQALKNGKIVVDSYEHTLAEAGELIQAGVTTSDVREIGELDTVENDQITGKGNLVLVKIVGLSIMDISVGTEILKESIENNIGTEVEF